MTEGRLTMTGTFTANQSSGGHDKQASTGSSSTGSFHWDQQNSASAVRHQEGDTGESGDVVTKIKDTINHSSHGNSHAEGAVFTSYGNVGTFVTDGKSDATKSYSAEGTVAGGRYSFTSFTNDEVVSSNSTSQGRGHNNIGTWTSEEGSVTYYHLSQTGSGAAGTFTLQNQMSGSRVYRQTYPGGSESVVTTELPTVDVEQYGDLDLSSGQAVEISQHTVMGWWETVRTESWNFVVGVGDGLTGGKLSDALEYWVGAGAGADKSSTAYTAGWWTGTVAGIALAFTPCGTALGALRFTLDAVNAGGSLISMGQSIAEGDGGGRRCTGSPRWGAAWA